MENLNNNEERILVVYTSFDRIDRVRDQFKYKLSKRYQLKDYFAINDNDDFNDANFVYSKLRQEILDFSPTIVLLYTNIAAQIHPRLFTKVLSRLTAEFTHLKFHHECNSDLNELSPVRDLAEISF